MRASASAWLVCVGLAVLFAIASADGGTVRVWFDVDKIDGKEGNKGCFVMEVHADWAPLGAGRMMEMLDSGFWTNIKFFRVVPDFMAQFGISGDPAVSAQWRTKTIKDDPVTQTNQRGFVSFATSGPDSRTTQMFINFVNNDFLDKDGFSPFAKIIKGMEVVDHIYQIGELPQQSKIQSEGNAYLDKNFPQLTYISSARVMAPEEDLDTCSNPTIASDKAGSGSPLLPNQTPKSTLLAQEKR